MSKYKNKGSRIFDEIVYKVFGIPRNVDQYIDTAIKKDFIPEIMIDYELKDNTLSYGSVEIQRHRLPSFTLAELLDPRVKSREYTKSFPIRIDTTLKIFEYFTENSGNSRIDILKSGENEKNALKFAIKIKKRFHDAGVKAEILSNRYGRTVGVPNNYTGLTEPRYTIIDPSTPFVEFTEPEKLLELCDSFIEKYSKCSEIFTRVKD